MGQYARCGEVNVSKKTKHLQIELEALLELIELEETEDIELDETELELIELLETLELSSSQHLHGLPNFQNPLFYQINIFINRHY